MPWAIGSETENRFQGLIQRLFAINQFGVCLGLILRLHRRQFAKQFAAQLPYLIQREVDLSFEVIHEHVDDSIGEEVNLEHADARIAGQRVQMDVLVDAVDADAFQFVDELTRQIGGDGSWRRAIDVLPRCDDAWALRIACDSLRREDKRAQLLQLRIHHPPLRRHLRPRWHDGLDMETGDTPCDWFAGLHPRQRQVQKERSASLKTEAPRVRLRGASLVSRHSSVILSSISPLGVWKRPLLPGLQRGSWDQTT